MEELFTFGKCLDSTVPKDREAGLRISEHLLRMVACASEVFKGCDGVCSTCPLAGREVCNLPAVWIYGHGKWLQEQFQAGNDYCELKPKHEVERSEEHLVLDVRGEVFSSFGIMDEYRFRCEVIFDCPMPDSGHFMVFDLRQGGM